MMDLKDRKINHLTKSLSMMTSKVRVNRTTLGLVSVLGLIALGSELHGTSADYVSNHLAQAYFMLFGTVFIVIGCCEIAPSFISLLRNKLNIYMVLYRGLVIGMLMLYIVAKYFWLGIALNPFDDIDIIVLLIVQVGMLVADALTTFNEYYDVVLVFKDDEYDKLARKNA